MTGMSWKVRKIMENSGVCSRRFGGCELALVFKRENKLMKYNIPGDVKLPVS